MGAAVVHVNLADTASCQASSSIIDAQPTLTQQVHVERRWRALNAIAWLIYDLGGLVTIDTVGVFGLTATAGRVRISSSDMSGEAGDLYDSGALAIDQNYLSIVSLADQPVSGRYVRIDLSHASSAYVEAGRACIGLRSSYEANFSYGWSRSFADPSRRTRTAGGQTQIDRRQVYRVLEMSFDAIGEAERDGFVEAIDRDNALKRDLLFITDPDSSNLARDSVWGLMSEATPVVQTFDQRFTKTYRIEERR